MNRTRIRSVSLQVNTIPRELSSMDTANALHDACDTWARAAGLSLPWMRYVSRLGTDIIIGFGNLDEVSTRLAEDVLGYTQEVEGGHQLITFANNVEWALPPVGFFAHIRRIFQRGNDLRTFALHELGHALGLDHNNEWDSVMNPAPEGGGLVDQPSPRDIERVRQIFFPPEPADPEEQES